MSGAACVGVVAAHAAPVAGAVAPAAHARTSAAAPRVETMVVGRQGEALSAARVRTARATRLVVGGRRCAVGAATPLAALAATPLALRFKDFGSCSPSRPRDATGLFVTTVAGQRNRGSNGWVYKVGSRAGTAGAADLGGPFGDGRRLRAHQQVLWFWCVMGAKGCQRTLVVTAARRSVRQDEAIVVTVTGNDDRGKAVPVAGARVTFQAGQAVTGPDGGATLPATEATPAGGAAVSATAPGLVRSFPANVTVSAP